MSLADITPPPGLLPPGMRAEPAGHGGGGGAKLFLAEAAPAEGPALLCVPGGYHGAWCYAHWLARFARAGIAAAALEPRGHGTLAAEGLDPATGVADFVDDLRAAVARFATPPVLLGHSLGALVVTAAAAAVPVAGLVLVAPSPPGNLPGAAPVPLLPEGAPVGPPSPEVVVARYLGGARPPGLAAYHAALCPESPRALNDRYALRVAVEPARLAGLPVLVLEAGRDDHERHPPGQDRALAAFLDAEHVLLPEAPHCVMLAPWEAGAAAPVIAWYRARFRPGR